MSSGDYTYRPKSAAETSRNMSAIRSENNKTETALRKALHRRGFRYRKYLSDLPGKPDIVFTKQKVAVFVDGDYWHGRVLREKGLEGLRQQMKTPNRKYWVEKLQRNAERDDFVTATLEANGWLVLRFWESDIKSDLGPAVDEVAAAVQRRRAESK